MARDFIAADSAFHIATMVKLVFLSRNAILDICPPVKYDE